MGRGLPEVGYKEKWGRALSPPPGIDQSPSSDYLTVYVRWDVSGLIGPTPASGSPVQVVFAE